MILREESWCPQDLFSLWEDSAKHADPVARTFFANLLVAPDNFDIALGRAIFLLDNPHAPLQPVVRKLATMGS